MTRLVAEWFPEFAKELDTIDDLYKKKRMIDEKPTNSTISLLRSRVVQHCASGNISKEH
jgi:hypothetical protein